MWLPIAIATWLFMVRTLTAPYAFRLLNMMRLRVGTTLQMELRRRQTCRPPQTGVLRLRTRTLTLRQVVLMFTGAWTLTLPPMFWCRKWNLKCRLKLLHLPIAQRPFDLLQEVAMLTALLSGMQPIAPFAYPRSEWLLKSILQFRVVLLGESLKIGAEGSLLTQRPWK